MHITMTRAGVALGMRRLAGIAVFVVPLGFAFGSAAVAAGLTPAQAVAMSLTAFAGASQFAVLDLWREPLPLLSIALVALAVNARHIIFGAALAPAVNALPRPRRFLALLFLSDANFADMQAARREGIHDLGLLFGGGLMMWAMWVAGTAIGVWVGGSAGEVSRYGLDVLMAAFFMTIVVGGLRVDRRWLPAAVAALVAVAGLPVLPNGWNILLGALAGGLTGAFSNGR